MHKPHKIHNHTVTYKANNYCALNCTYVAGRLNLQQPRIIKLLHQQGIFYDHSSDTRYNLRELTQ